MSVAERYAKALISAAVIKRSPVTKGATRDMVVGKAVEIASGVPCQIVPMEASDDMMVVGPLPRRHARGFFLVGVDLQSKDHIECDGTVWVVEDPPVAELFRGQPHHVEVHLEERAISDG